MDWWKCITQEESLEVKFDSDHLAPFANTADYLAFFEIQNQRC